MWGQSVRNRTEILKKFQGVDSYNNYVIIIKK